MRRVTISAKLPETLVDLADDLVKLQIYPSRSEVIRTALWDLIKREHPKFASNPMFKKERKEEGDPIENP